MIRCGERMAALRDKTGLTQEELSGKLGISRAALSHYETNRREPDYLTLCTIADYYQVSLDYILCRTDDPSFTSTPDSAPDPIDLGEYTTDGRMVVLDGLPLTPEEAERLVCTIRDERESR
ncbi:helix-turn-helix domain-containing protein [Paenibacillus koleovorans]|uniref:helix-turn-helix domain-containing protein n=1 Tax=Paenibacillus koleovorans TaxID=121608 RepID=UPI000FD84C00|nr:helix-turn-helix transcriptional regulator [Paenibacillus koleovorans]